MKKKSFFEHRGYWQYLASQLFGGGFLHLYRRLLAVLRPTLWLRRILRLFVWLVLLLESGAIFLLLSLVSLLLLPPMTLLFAVLLPSAMRSRSKVAAWLLPLLRDKRIVLLRTDGEALAKRLVCDGYFVLRIMPPRRGLRHFTRPTESELVLSPWLYFSLRRRIFASATRVICVENFRNDLARGHRHML